MPSLEIQIEILENRRKGRHKQVQLASVRFSAASLFSGSETWDTKRPFKIHEDFSFVYPEHGGGTFLFNECQLLDCVWNVMAHTQKPDFVFRQNGRVYLYRRGCQFSRLLAAEMCASAVVMLDTPCAEVVGRVLATRSIRQFPLHFPYRASPCAITFQLDSTTVRDVTSPDDGILHTYSGWDRISFSLIGFLSIMSNFACFFLFLVRRTLPLFIALCRITLFVRISNVWRVEGEGGLCAFNFEVFIGLIFIYYRVNSNIKKLT